MRQAIATIAVFLLFTQSSWAQSSIGRVKSGSVTVRSGPSEQMPACGILEQGEEVIIHHLEGKDWLAIQAPRGSLSWISQLCVEIQRLPNEPANRLPVDAVVVLLDSGDVKIAAGTMGDAKPLNVQRTKIPAGTIVRIIGPKVTLNSEQGESGWYPIVPPRDDYRYLPKSAVEVTSQIERGSFVVKTPPGSEASTSASIPVSIPNGQSNTTTTTNDANWPSHPLWRDAERARSDGNYTKAEELYFQLAKVANQSGDVRLANLCYERVHLVRELSRSTKPASPVVNWKSEEPKPPSPATILKEAQPTKSTNMLADGILRRVNFQYANQKVYALTNQKGAVRYYILLNNLDLDQQVGRWVELSGAASYPREFGGDVLISATRVESIK